MPDVRFNKYYRYNELTRILKEFAKEFPKLVHVESIGKSFEGRDIWVATVTNTETGYLCSQIAGRARHGCRFWLSDHQG